MAYTFIESQLDEVCSAIERTDTFAIDLETTGLNPVDSRILLCQIGTGDEEFVIDARKVKLESLLPYLRSKKWRKLIFNAKFEDKFFQHFYNQPIYNVFDCYLAEKVLHPDATWGNSFEDLALRYLDVRLDKKVRQSFLRPIKDFSEKQKQYAAADVQYLFPLYHTQVLALEEKELTKIAELEFEVATIVASMELQGVKIDITKWRSLLSDYSAKRETSRQKMFEIMFDDNDVLDEQLGMFERDAINLRSPVQLKSAFNKLGIDADATDERTLEKIDHPAAKELLVYRKLQKVETSYGQTIIDKVHPFTGRIHAEFKQLGTETGRFSCEKPNLQQMPEDFRGCFVSDEGYVFVGADYSQIELRILADVSGDAALSAAFRSGHDVHMATAASMFNVTFADVTKEQRFAAKTLNFGIMYGMGVEKLMDSLNKENDKNNQKHLNIRQVQAIHHRYKNTYRKATDWLESAGKKAIREGYSETMYGRKRFYNRPTSALDRKQYERQLAGIARQGANSPIQGTCADITKLAMLQLHNTLNEYGYRGKIVLQVHDEIVVLAHRTQAESIKELLVESMTVAANSILRNVPVKVDSYVSEIWKK